jgi:hypothetical protein
MPAFRGPHTKRCLLWCTRSLYNALYDPRDAVFACSRQSRSSRLKPSGTSLSRQPISYIIKHYNNKTYSKTSRPPQSRDSQATGNPQEQKKKQHIFPLHSLNFSTSIRTTHQNQDLQLTLSAMSAGRPQKASTRQENTGRCYECNKNGKSNKKSKKTMTKPCSEHESVCTQHVASTGLEFWYVEKDGCYQCELVKLGRA